MIWNYKKKRMRRKIWRRHRREMLVQKIRIKQEIVKTKKEQAMMRIRHRLVQQNPRIVTRSRKNTNNMEFSIKRKRKNNIT
jgi:DNA polymerase elongation subunit (family B)